MALVGVVDNTKLFRRLSIGRFIVIKDSANLDAPTITGEPLAQGP